MPKKNNCKIKSSFNQALRRNHNLAPDKDFVVKTQIGGGNRKVIVEFVAGKKPDDYEEVLKKVAEQQRVTLELKEAA